MCPEGVNEAAVRKTLLNEFGLEIGAGPRPARRQDLALRPDGLLVPPGQRDAVPVGARFGAVRHGTCRSTSATPKRRPFQNAM